jgi:hypothetical protein
MSHVSSGTNNDNHVFDPIASMLEPDTLSLQQYLDSWRGAGHFQPERRLLFAILQDAVECFQKYRCARGNKASRLFKDATAWFFEDDYEWPFSFINICESFGIDPGYLRKGLSRWVEADGDPEPPCRQHIILSATQANDLRKLRTSKAKS